MRLPTSLPFSILLAVFATPAFANWHAILPRQTDPNPPTPTESGPLSLCLWTSYSILRSQPTQPPGLVGFHNSAITEAARHPYYLAQSSLGVPIERLDRTSICSIFINDIASRQLSMLPPELSPVYSTYEQAKTSWIEEIKPKVSQFSEECVGALGTSSVGDFLQGFATNVEGCVTNADMIWGKLDTATLTETREDIWDSPATGDWQVLTTATTTTSSTAAGARETGYLVPVLGLAGAVVWAGGAVA
ncbi:hypothetical protein B0T21DRAFT_348706 [Apiosordaria backusii]|uniref:Uncharacterized protein n=1 Tax=Apiosordaria backusii TaxID=314023 RepID=A0AA40BM45_9PEZI|nr:hypothetical protein B0T21DRAFT_348706 [Apiosordaria backusii]